MEVHHHTHAGPDSHRGKKFKEYFLEFLMLFLAVTLGFIAENIRESLRERSKEKEYLIGIKKDLVADTSSLNDFMPTLRKRIEQSDSLISFLQVEGPTDYGSEMYYLARLSTRQRVHRADNTTLTVLEHSGDFRLITKQAVVVGLVRMQKLIDTYTAITSLDEQEGQMAYPLLANLFDASVFNTMESKVTHFELNLSATSTSNIARPAGNPQLRNYNPDTINQLIYYLHERKGSFIGEMGILQQEKQAATELIQTINAAYHLKENK